MADEKKKAERHFNWQDLKEAVERMKPELRAASEATHKHGADDTPDDSDFDRTVALGYELGRSRPFGVSATLTLCTCAISSNPIICTSATLKPTI